MISSRTHGFIDYAMGILLIVAPWLLGFADGTAAQWVPVVLGIVMLGQAVMTDYELGLMRVIPFSVHLAMDFALGILLAASPWLFGFSGRVYWPHLILGIAEIGVAAMTTRRTVTVGSANLSRV
jgi:hypothetical protein